MDIIRLLRVILSFFIFSFQLYENKNYKSVKCESENCFLFVLLSNIVLTKFDHQHLYLNSQITVLFVLEFLPPPNHHNVPYFAVYHNVSCSYMRLACFVIGDSRDSKVCTVLDKLILVFLSSNFRQGLLAGQSRFNFLLG